MAYVTDAAGSIVLELVGRELQPMVEAWFTEPFQRAPVSPA